MTFPIEPDRWYLNRVGVPLRTYPCSESADLVKYFDTRTPSVGWVRVFRDSGRHDSTREDAGLLDIVAFLPERTKYASGKMGPPPGLRDQFATAALQGLLSNPGGPVQASPTQGWGFTNCSHSDVAKTAYLLADAMLKARE